MEIFFGTLLAIPFLYFNYKIIQTDLQEKKIPNKYLSYALCIIPFWYLYAGYFGYFGDLKISVFFLQTFLTFIVGFLLYHFHIWGAGDAKYVLVLSLYIPHIGIISYIGNIALITLGYLFLYFIWFLIGPNLWIKKRRNNLYLNLWRTKKDSFIYLYQKKTKKELFFHILKWINVFLLIFVSLRLLRLYLLDFILKNYNISYNDIISYLLYSSLGIYIVLAIGISVLLFIFIFKYVFSRVRNIFGKSNNLFLMILNIFGIGFLIFEYIKDSQDLLKKLLLIFTVYLALYFIFKILLFAYKLAFIANEENLIHINDLKEGMTIDKKCLDKKFSYTKGGNATLPKIALHLENINSYITHQDIIRLKKIHKILDDFHDKSVQYSSDHYVKILKTISYGIYIYLGFVVCLLFNNLLGKIAAFILNNFF